MKKSKLTLASISFIIILILWPVLGFFSLPVGSNYMSQIVSIKNDPTLHILNFIVAFLIAPAIIFMLYEFYKTLSNNTWSLLSKTGFVLYGIYFIIISISYGSQFLYLPFILDSSNKTEILRWYFYNGDSLAILLNQTGYLIWSIATLLIFTQFILKNSILFFSIKILTLSALLQIIATLGLYFDKSNLTSLSFYSGIFLLPASILILVYSLKSKQLTT